MHLGVPRHLPFTMTQLTDTTGWHHILTSQDVSVLRHYPFTMAGESPMPQGMVLQSSNIIWAQNNGYEQVWQPKQCHALRTGSKTGSIVQRAKLCLLPRLPQLLHALLDIICISTLHTAGKFKFLKMLWSCSRGRSSLASGICIIKVAAPSITCSISHLMAKTSCMGQDLWSLPA